MRSRARADFTRGVLTEGWVRDLLRRHRLGVTAP
jgi:hypothetical protein